MIIQAVTNSAEIIHPCQYQILHIRSERVAEPAAHRIHPGAHPFRYAIAAALNHIGVVSGAALHRIRTVPAIEQVGSAVSNQRIVQAVPGAVQIIRTQQIQVLHVSRQGIADTAVNPVCAGVKGFRYRVTGIVGIIHIIPGASCQRIRSGPSIQRVAAGIPGKHVSAAVARQNVIEGVAAAA